MVAGIGVTKDWIWRAAKPACWNFTDEVIHILHILILIYVIYFKTLKIRILSSREGENTQGEGENTQGKNTRGK